MYNLHWLEYWSEKHTPDNEHVKVIHTEESDGWYEHDFNHQIIAQDDDSAIDQAKQVVGSNEFTIEVYSLVDPQGKVILTEEEW